ncbi:MAG: FAD-dependent oxidoreductase [Planctomycetaceae bacterium]
MQYDIAVIGNDEAAFEMLCLAARSKRRTLAVLPETHHSAWLVTQALRRLITNLLVDRTPQRRRLFRQAGTPRLLQTLLARAIVKEVGEHREMLQTLGVDVMLGEARFSDSHRLLVSLGITCTREVVDARYIVIGTGIRRTAMHRPLGLMPFHRPETLFAGHVLPKSVCIVGGGYFGTGLAALISLFGVETRHIARADTTSTMLEMAVAAGVRVGHHPSDVGLQHFNAPFAAEGTNVVDCRRSVGFTDHLSLDAIHIEPDENGQLWCASSFETWCSGIFGIGDVVGFSPDTVLNPSIQAERILHRISQTVPRPHLADALAKSASSASRSRAVVTK